MDEEMVSLRWNNHLTILSQLLFSLREEESLADVTLACEGKLFSSHKFVLSMCSDYFKEMFMANPCKHPIVFMRDVRAEDMEALLDFVYQGVVHVPQTSLPGLLKTAEALQIRGLGLFNARDASPSSAPENTLTTMADRSNLPAAVESTVRITPEHKRTYEIEHDGGQLMNFSSEDLEDVSIVQHNASSSSSPSKKQQKLEHHEPPMPIPDLPKLGDEMLDMENGISISATDYYRFRRTNANRYINDLLRYFFPMKVLASSSLTGGECFANKERGPSNKNQLDPILIRVITRDAIRNFPNISEKQVRNAIRRKLNTESRIYRSTGRCGSADKNRSGSRSKKTHFSSRAQVSIEKSDREKAKVSHFSTLIAPNVTVEKSGKDVRRYTPMQISFDKNDKRDDDYFRQKPSTPTHELTPPMHQTSATPTPVATPTLSNVPSPTASMDKSYNLVKSEMPSSSYMTQEFTYMTPHVSQTTYLSHMPGSDPYLRRIEMSQPASHSSTLSSYYSHPTLPSESIEQNLHM